MGEAALGWWGLPSHSLKQAYYGLNCAPPKDDEVLTHSICECDPI